MKPLLGLLGMDSVRRIAKTIVLVLLSTHLVGQNPQDKTNMNTVLFKITSNSTAHTSCIFGTHHAFGKAFFDSLRTANQALSTCELVIKENLNIPGQMAGDIINKRTAITPWKKFLTKDDMEFVEALFSKSPTDYTKMTPTELFVFLNRYFNQHICLGQDKRDTSLSLDDYIGLKAAEQSIAQHGLETTAEQLALIDRDVAGMPRKVHKKRLAGVVDNIRHEKANLCGETAWYKAMNIDYRLDAPCGNKLMLTDRNANWLVSINALLEANNCFIAVGLGHLMYECGLINQLRKQGYSITPVAIN